jgi:hypothetical protein
MPEHTKNIRAIKLLGVVLTSLAIGVSTTATAQPDPQQDGDILSIINQSRKVPLKPNQLCISRPTQLSGSVVVGVKDGSWECPVTYVVVGSGAMSVVEAGTYLLNAQQWHEKAPVDRAELAKTWVIHAVFAFKRVQLKPADIFPTTSASFHGPRADADGTGGAVITAWVQLPVTKTRGVQYARLQVTVDYNGITGATRELQRVNAATPKKPEPETSTQKRLD